MIEEKVLKHFGDNQKLGIKEICLADLDLNFRLREIVDEGRYYIEFLIPIIINDIKLVMIAEQNVLKISRELNQGELTNILYDLQERAEHIIKNINAC